MIFAMGVDLGQSQDFTVASLIQRRELWQTKEGLPGTLQHSQSAVQSFTGYDIRDMWRPPLKTAYTDIVDDVYTKMHHPRLTARCHLVVDATGVGRPVLDQMYGKGLTPVGMIITGGHSVTIDSDGLYHVPKAELVTCMELVFQSKRMRIAEFPLASAFREELQMFTRKISKAANDTYEAFSDKVHDDMVMSVAMGIWYLEQLYGDRAIIRDPDTKKAEPFDELRLES